MITLLISVIAVSLGGGIGYGIRALQGHMTKQLPWYDRPTTLCKRCKKPLSLHGYAGYTFISLERTWISGSPYYCYSNSMEVFAAMDRNKQLLLEVGDTE